MGSILVMVFMWIKGVDMKGSFYKGTKMVMESILVEMRNILGILNVGYMKGRDSWLKVD